jgi:hypothetical protein
MVANQYDESKLKMTIYCWINNITRGKTRILGLGWAKKKKKDFLVGKK